MAVFPAVVQWGAIRLFRGPAGAEEGALSALAHGTNPHLLVDYLLGNGTKPSRFSKIYNWSASAALAFIQNEKQYCLYSFFS